MTLLDNSLKLKILIFNWSPASNEYLLNLFVNWSNSIYFLLFEALITSEEKIIGIKISKTKNKFS